MARWHSRDTPAKSRGLFRLGTTLPGSARHCRCLKTREPRRAGSRLSHGVCPWAEGPLTTTGTSAGGASGSRYLTGVTSRLRPHPGWHLEPRLELGRDLLVRRGRRRGEERPKSALAPRG